MTIEDFNHTKTFIHPLAQKHDIFAPVHHWQLRDMIKPHALGIVYCDTQNVTLYDPQTRVKDVLYPNLYFIPTALAQHEGLVAVVGNKGQLLVVKESVYRAQVGGTINNSVQIYGNPPRIFVCSNDGCIKIYDAECFRLLQCLKHKYPINNCAVSPDGKKMVAVGDTPHVYEYFYEDGFLKYDVVRSVKDGGFKVSWNSLSDTFAVSTQDGYVCVWDIRNKEKIYQIPSKQNPSTKGAVRVVEFSKKNNLDLLMFTEHLTYVNFIDTRSYLKRQDVGVGTRQQEKSISGAFFSEDGNSVYVSVEDSVFEYKINKEMRRIFDSHDIR